MQLASTIHSLFIVSWRDLVLIFEWRKRRRPILILVLLFSILRRKAAATALGGGMQAGTPNHMDNMSALQQHVAFFDRNKDGVIYPWETYKGFRAIGFNMFISVLSAVFINVSLSYPTSHSRIPSLLFPIYVDNIHKGKHGSDSDVYNSEGEFDPAKFDAIFSKYASTYSDRLTYAEMKAMLKGNRDVNDVLGRIAAKAEWSFLYKLAKNKEGFLEKDAMRGLYDGSLFVYFENQHNASAQPR